MASGEIHIAPSILAADFLRLGEEVERARTGGADRLQIDVMDGRFVPNITVGPDIVRAVRGVTDAVLEAHLMIVEPEKYIGDFAAAGADVIIVHQEVSPHLYRTLQHIRQVGKSPGVAINPGTPWEVLVEVLALVDLVLVMTVNPGFGGQEFIESMVPKIRAVSRELERRGLSARVEVDGGINEETARATAEAGARVLVAGTSVYRAEDGIGPAIERLRRAAQEGVQSAAVPQ